MAQAADTAPPTTTTAPAVAGAQGTASEAGATASAPATTFSTTGSIPPVDTKAVAAGPTASERAFGKPKGPGVTALETLLAKGPPQPKQVVDVIDAHRDERDAVLAAVESALGPKFVQQVREGISHLRASIPRRELVAGDPSDASSGYFVASQAEQGARWRTADGGFTGTAGKQGLDTKVRVDPHDTVHAHVGTDQSGTVAWERDGKNEGELYGSYHSGKNLEAGARRTWDVDGGKLTGGVRHKAAADGTTDGAFATYKNGGTTVDASAGVQGGQLAGSASTTFKPTAHDTVSASVAHDSHGTTESAGEKHTFDHGSLDAQIKHGPGGTTGSLAGTYDDHGKHVDGNITRGADRTSLHVGASDQISPQLSVSGHLDDVIPDKGKHQTTLGLSERYRSGKLVEGVDLEAGQGAKDYLKSTASLDAQLGKNLYGGGFGSFQLQEGQHTSAQLGASLTFTPSEKTALTLAGVLDQSGALETRLQLDVFKSKVANVGDLADHKKDALVSLFVSYAQGGNHQMLDDRFGAPQIGTSPQSAGAGQVMAGIRIKF